MHDDYGQAPDYYRDPRTGEILTGPGADLARRRDAQATPRLTGYTRLIRELELAVIDGREDDRKRIEAAIMRAQLSMSLRPADPPGVSWTRDTAAQAFTKLDAEQRAHDRRFVERPWSKATSDLDLLDIQRNRTGR